jgi:hypothetical protein
MLLVPLFALAACGESSTSAPPASHDAGTDVSTTADTGAGPDAPPAMDASSVADVPPSPDVSAAPDRGTPASDGSIRPPNDLGNPFGDAGALGEPPWAMLDVRTSTSCPPLVACGGAVLGTWDVSGGCIDVPVPSQLMMCPGARVTRSVGRARGRVTFGPLIANRAAQWEVEVELFIPQVCAAFAGGCVGIQSTVRNALPDSVCVSEGAGDCRCAARQSGNIRDADGYTTMNNQIVSATLNKRWNYCIEGTRLRYQDVSAMGEREPGRIELTRRAP